MRLPSPPAGNSPSDPDGVCAVLAVLWRFGEADVTVFVDPSLVDKEVLVDLHNSCRKRQAEGTMKRILHTHTHSMNKLRPRLLKGEIKI